jgi:uncharacterized protein
MDPFHLGFPLALSDGIVTATPDADYVEALMEQILFTVPGERVNRPDFGCGIQYTVFKPMGSEMVAATLYVVQSELQRWLEGLARIQSVDAVPDGGVLLVTVKYVDLRTGTPAVARYRR